MVNSFESTAERNEKELYTEAELLEMAESDPIFAQTIGDAFYTWNDYFAEVYDKHLTKDEFTKKLVHSHRFTMLTADDLKDVQNTFAKPELLNKTPHESYPDATEKDIASLVHHQSKDRCTPVIIASIKGKLIMLDGDHRAIATAMKGEKLPAFIVDLE